MDASGFDRCTWRDLRAWGMRLLPYEAEADCFRATRGDRPAYVEAVRGWPVVAAKAGA